MYDSTSTFKTRRKHHLLLLTCLATLVYNVASMAVPISCPEPCECYLNNNGLQSARCSEIYMNQTAFPNIHVLVVRMSETQDQCDIPKDLNVIFPQLNYLYMMNCSLTNISEHAFETLKYLQEIDLSNNFVETIESAIFVNNPKLTYANLKNNPLRELDNKPFLISKSINELDLSSCGIKKLPPKMFKSLPKLRYLTLYNNELSTIAKDTLPEGIRVLNLGKNSITHVPIAQLEHLLKLREIDLSENPINCTCSTLSFQDHLSSKPVIFLNNGMECMYPAEYKGRQLAHVPFMEICMAELAALKPDQDEDRDLKINEILPEEKSDKKKHKKGKKDNIQDDFERDEVVPYDKKSYIDEMQSDSAGEGSGGGSDELTGTNMPDFETTDSSKKSNNNETNETKQDGSSPTTVSEISSSSPTTVSEKSSSVALAESENKSDVTSYKEELKNTNSESTTNSVSLENEKHTGKTEPNPPPPSPPLETLKPEPEIPTTLATSPQTSASSTESPIPNSEATTQQPESPKNEPETSPPLGSNGETIFVPPTPITLVPANPPPTENPSSPVSNSSTTPEPESAVSSTEPHLVGKQSSDHGTHVESSISHALQNDNSNSMNLGYIIPCLAILIVIIICLGIYLGQRSSHKNWEPAGTNDGAELQDVSLLPENGKMPIVKNKYPAEGNSEQTERLMKDSNSSAPKSVWEHLEEPLENGNSIHPKDSDKLPNGQSIDKNEPIECAIAKVTTLPDSVPRTPLIRNT